MSCGNPRPFFLPAALECPLTWPGGERAGLARDVTSALLVACGARAERESGRTGARKGESSGPRRGGGERELRPRLREHLPPLPLICTRLASRRHVVCSWGGSPFLRPGRVNALPARAPLLSFGWAEGLPFPGLQCAWGGGGGAPQPKAAMLGKGEWWWWWWRKRLREAGRKWRLGTAPSRSLRLHSCAGLGGFRCSHPHGGSRLPCARCHLPQPGSAFASSCTCHHVGSEVLPSLRRPSLQS